MRGLCRIFFTFSRFYGVIIPARRHGSMLLTFRAPELEFVFKLRMGKFLGKNIFFRLYESFLQLYKNFLRRCLPEYGESPFDATLFITLALSISFVLVSIAVSQILLAVACIGYIGKSKWAGIKALLHHPIILPLVAFILWTTAVSLLTPNSLQNLLVLKKLFIYLLLFLVPAVGYRKNSMEWIYKMVFIFIFVACSRGLIQLLSDPQRDLLHRISGFFSHWMTYSGILMLVFIMLLAYALCMGWRRHIWIIPLAGLIAFILVMTETRSAWLGTIAGIFVLILLRHPRAIGVLLVVILAVYFVSPDRIKQRLNKSWDLKDPNTSNRVELFQTSIRLIKENPWLGVGPHNVYPEALRYRGSDRYEEWMYQHMHNNILQIAAERGIPGLIIWLWFMLRLLWGALRAYRAKPGGLRTVSSESVMVSTAALGAWVAFMLAGIFEYNFGDSEVLTLFLFIMSAPYAFRQFTEHVPSANLEIG